MLIQAKKLKKRFGSKTVLQNISLEVAQGEIFGVIGSSGAGKSTLLRCLSTLEKEFEGEVLFKGRPFSFEEKKALRRERKSPITRLPLQPHQLIPRPDLKALINTRLRMHQERIQQIMEQQPELFLPQTASSSSATV